MLKKDWKLFHIKGARKRQLNVIYGLGFSFALSNIIQMGKFKQAWNIIVLMPITSFDN